MGNDIILNDGLIEYIQNSTPSEPQILKELRKETKALGNISIMQISWIQARFMQSLAKMTNTKIYLEVGTFTGYSALAMALVLPTNGEVVTLDKNEEWTKIAQRFWQKANVEDKVSLLINDAKLSLKSLLKNGYKNKIDMIFLDADKRAMATYLDKCYDLLKEGGLILIDNVLWQGNVINPKDERKNTKAIIDFNKNLKNDPRFFVSMIPIGDGITLAIKN